MPIEYVCIDGADSLYPMSYRAEKWEGENYDKLCKLFQLPPCSYQDLFVQFQQFCADGRIYGRRLALENGFVKFVRMRNLYNGTIKYIVTVSDITGMV